MDDKLPKFNPFQPINKFKKTFRRIEKNNPIAVTRKTLTAATEKQTTFLNEERFVVERRLFMS